MAHKAHGLNELREMFLAFFETKEHLRLPSFSLIPQNDPSLLIINSGMAPMKPYFTGEVEPPRRRVCTCQKCIRTGDIENIGKTARHGTYFEMLGNFSFGDYFKKESLAWSWEFLTSAEWVGLDADRLYPSVYEQDDEAFDIWVNDIGVPAHRVVRMGKADNFWEHGTGPCGPCSEIYYDRGVENGCGKPDCYPGCDCDRFMEVWNNVFSQFDNDGEGNYTELAQKNIDTGMGLERLACVCQGVDSLFDVDTVMNITNKVSEITGATYGQTHKMDVSLRVITDHIRSATFMICDGILPSNEGRGYVLRRLLRRAARHGKLLGVNDPFLYKVCDTVIHENECAYPDLREKQDYITRIIKVEEENFAKTIDTGLRILADFVESHKAKGETVFSGEDAFKLYDTYGFPLDLTQDILAEQGMSVDEAAFTALMQEQKERARAARGDMSNAWQGLDLGLDNTPTAFTGYTCTEDTAVVLALVTEGEVSGVMKAGDEGIIVLDKTPFYAEMGGQSADFGTISCGDVVFTVTDVQKNKGGKYLHHGKLSGGELRVGETVACKLDMDRRQAIMRAHSATHLLQKALRTVLGDHVQQAGSLVEPDKLRFDFTHFAPMTHEEKMAVEELVNASILMGYEIVTEEMSIEEAKTKGAMMLFGEKYGESVRVVDMGGYSVELCGGTHLNNTAKAGPFHITAEFSVASGVRRIEATTGLETIHSTTVLEETIAEAAGIIKAKPGELLSKVAAQMEEIKALHREIEQLKAKAFAGEAAQILFGAKTVGAVKVLTAVKQDMPVDDLRKMGDTLRDKDASVVAVLASINGEKISILAVCGKDAVKSGIKAGELVKKVCGLCGGSGGGKPDSAMGGGKDAQKLDEALAAVEGFVAEKLGL